MNFDYSQEQQQLMQEARRFLDDCCPAQRVRSVLEDRAHSYDKVLWQSVADLGWLGTSIPERFGGLGLGYVELCALAEELGRVLAPIPFSSTLYFFAEALMLAGSERQCEEWLPRIARGELIGCLATSEGPGLPQGVGCSVESGLLVGTKIPVTDGDVAQIALVLAKEAGAPGLFVVDLSDPAVARSVLQSIDGTRGLARLSFEGAQVERLGAAGEGCDCSISCCVAPRCRSHSSRSEELTDVSSSPASTHGNVMHLAGRSAAIKRSNTGWLICMSRTSWPARMPITPPGHWQRERPNCRLLPLPRDWRPMMHLGLRPRRTFTFTAAWASRGKRTRTFIFVGHVI